MGKLIRNGIEYGGGNGTDIFEVTQAEYDALVQAGTLVHNALYVISDAPNLNATASDIEYSGAATVKQAIDSKPNIATYELTGQTLTANTAFTIGSVSTVSGGKISSYTQLKGLFLCYGFGSNTNVRGFIGCGANNNIAFVPNQSDTNVTICIGILY